MLSDAIAFAAEAHRTQKRKGSGLPYVTHPLEVMVLLIRHGVHDEAVLAAGVLHDVVEDCEVPPSEIQRRFGEKVASIVAALTKPKDAHGPEGKARALDQVRRGPEAARVVKMADRLSNILDLEVTGWSPEKKASYLREALEIAAIGKSALPSLGETLERTANAKRAASAPSG